MPTLTTEKEVHRALLVEVMQEIREEMQRIQEELEVLEEFV